MVEEVNLITEFRWVRTCDHGYRRGKRTHDLTRGGSDTITTTAPEKRKATQTAALYQRLHPRPRAR